MPHRSAYRQRRFAQSQAAECSRSRDRRYRRCGRGRARCSGAWRACRHSLARAHVRALPYCLSARENLCDAPLFTGYTRDGGFATHVLADAAYAFPLDGFDDPVAAAPLMCAGLIGWRSLGMAGDGHRIGLYGFGAAAHILVQVCRWQGREVYAFTRPCDEPAQRLALSLGARWAGSSDVAPPVALDAAIIFAPVGALVPHALSSVRKGGRVVCGGIHMSDIPQFPLQPPVGRTPTRVGCEPNPAGWDRLPRCCITGRRDDNDDGLPT